VRIPQEVKVMRPVLLAVLLAVVCRPSIAADSVPALTIWIYAPEQKGAPLHITAFHYQDAGIGVTVRNDTAKMVVGFSAGALLSIPPGCLPQEDALSSRQEVSTQSGLGEKIVQIRPHQTAVVLEDAPTTPAHLVFAAQLAKAAYLQVQVGIGLVRFADGSSWLQDKPTVSEANPAGLLDSGLPSAGSMPCQRLHVDEVLNALAKVDRVGFGGRLTVDDHLVERPNRVALPHIVFSCLLNDALATCPHVATKEE
jgi:hypothetical protein